MRLLTCLLASYDFSFLALNFTFYFHWPGLYKAPIFRINNLISLNMIGKSNICLSTMPE